MKIYFISAGPWGLKIHHHEVTKVNKASYNVGEKRRVTKKRIDVIEEGNMYNSYVMWTFDKDKAESVRGRTICNFKEQIMKFEEAIERVKK